MALLRAIAYDGIAQSGKSFEEAVLCQCQHRYNNVTFLRFVSKTDKMSLLGNNRWKLDIRRVLTCFRVNQIQS